jgi:hypothetical protein
MLSPLMEYRSEGGDANDHLTTCESTVCNTKQLMCKRMVETRISS